MQKKSNASSSRERRDLLSSAEGHRGSAPERERPCGRRPDSLTLTAIGGRRVRGLTPPATSFVLASPTNRTGKRVRCRTPIRGTWIETSVHCVSPNAQPLSSAGTVCRISATPRIGLTRGRLRNGLSPGSRRPEHSAHIKVKPKIHTSFVTVQKIAADSAVAHRAPARGLRDKVEIDVRNPISPLVRGLFWGPRNPHDTDAAGGPRGTPKSPPTDRSGPPPGPQGPQKWKIWDFEIGNRGPTGAPQWKIGGPGGPGAPLEKI